MSIRDWIYRKHGQGSSARREIYSRRSLCLARAEKIAESRKEHSIIKINTLEKFAETRKEHSIIEIKPAGAHVMYMYTVPNKDYKERFLNNLANNNLKCFHREAKALGIEPIANKREFVLYHRSIVPF